MKRAKCVVCILRDAVPGNSWNGSLTRGNLCDRCDTDYYKPDEQDDPIAWAAKRARRYALKARKP